MSLSSQPWGASKHDTVANPDTPIIHCREREWRCRASPSPLVKRNKSIYFPRCLQGWKGTETHNTAECAQAPHQLPASPIPASLPSSPTPASLPRCLSLGPFCWLPHPPAFCCLGAFAPAAAPSTGTALPPALCMTGMPFSSVGSPPKPLSQRGGLL